MYKFDLINVPDATDGTRMGGINDAGEAVVYASGFGFDHYYHAYTYYETGNLVPLSGTKIPSQTSANSINNEGDIVGTVGSAPVGIKGYLLTAADGSYQTIVSSPTTASGLFDRAYGINDNKVVVGADYGDFQHDYGFTWQNGTMSFFQYPGAVTTEARGINNPGEIVGVYTTASNAPDHGFIDNNGQFSTLDVPGATATDPAAVNLAGIIVGSYSDGKNWHGFVDDNGKMSFVNAPNAANTWLTGINKNGDLSGYYNGSTNQPTTGFVAHNMPDPPPPPPPSPLSVLDTTTNTPIAATGTPYNGPVAGLQNQYINASVDGLNVTASTPNWFIHTGSGTDAIAVNGGINVLDGGTGSNFLVGANGTDTFFVDDRNAPSDIWSTVVGFHQGDAATIWGVTPQDFNLSWVDNQGAAGYAGLTLHATSANKPTASLTLAGYTSADLGNGRLSIQFGTDTASGSPFMYVHGN